MSQTPTLEMIRDAVFDEFPHVRNKVTGEFLRGRFVPLPDARRLFIQAAKELTLEPGRRICEACGLTNVSSIRYAMLPNPELDSRIAEQKQRLLDRMRDPSAGATMADPIPTLRTDEVLAELDAVKVAISTASDRIAERDDRLDRVVRKMNALQSDFRRLQESIDLIAASAAEVG